MFPTINVPLSFSFGKSSKDKQESPVSTQTSSDAAMISVSSDLVIVLMLIAVVMMSSAVLVYAARH